MPSRRAAGCAAASVLLLAVGCVDRPSSGLATTRDGDARGVDSSSAADAASDAAPAWRLPDAAPPAVSCGADAGLEVYEQRIEPLFADERPQSCSQCHLSGLDLSLFVRDTPCQTFACLVDLGLVDERRPDDSKVLRWIGRAEPQSTLITERVIREEYDAFRLWVHTQLACDECDGVSCSSSRDAGTCALEPAPGSDLDLEALDPGGCEDSKLYELFTGTVYASRGRCTPCHETTADFEQFEAPQWMEVRGDCESAAQRTLWNLYETGLIDLQQPERSLLLTKPLPESLGGVAHAGGAKFHDKQRDPGYRAFAYFVERFAACKRSDGGN